MSARILASAPYALAALAALTVIALGAGRPWDVERDLVWIRGTAWCALGALALALCASPVGAVLVRLEKASPRAVAAARRALGISAAALATLHAGLALSTWLADAWHLALELAWVRSGVLAWAILAALWLTSFPRVVAALRVKLWKPLHRLAYVALALAVHHALLSPLAPRAPVLALGATVVAVGLLRLAVRRRRPPVS